MKKMYRLEKNLYMKSFIKEIEVVKETPKTVTIHNPKWRDYRENKRSSYSSIFETWKEAHQEALNIAKKKVRNLESSLESAKDKLVEIEKLKEDMR